MISKFLLPWRHFCRSRSSFVIFMIIVSSQNHHNGFGVVDATKNSSAVAKSTDNSDKIVGGVPAIMGEFPFYAIPASNWLCGATLIHGDFLVSAAHCGSKVWSKGLWLSTTNRNQLQVPPSTFYPMRRLVIHPNFTDSDNSNDIMLIQITKFIRNVPIVTMNFDRYKPKTGSLLTGIGYGRTQEGGDVSDRLMKVNFFATSSAECQKSYSGLKKELMLCNGYKNGGKDTCQGDSGGPIFLNRTLVGLVSFGRGCARPNIPAVNTRISAYKRWIRSTICQYSTVKPKYCAKLKLAKQKSVNTKPAKNQQRSNNRNRSSSDNNNRKKS